MSGTKKKRRRKIIYRKKSQNRASMILAIIVMTVILVAVVVRGIGLSQKLQGYDEKKQQLQENIASEQERSKQIEQYSKYTQTDEYVEEVAREKLGLVKEGETVFRKDGRGSSSSAGESSTEGETVQTEAGSQNVQEAQEPDQPSAESAAQAADGSAAGQNAQPPAGSVNAETP